MSNDPPPIACTLSDEAFRARRAELRQLLRTSVQETRERDDGYELRFERTPETIATLGELIAFESACCEFLRFGLDVAVAGGPVWLTIGGSQDAKRFVRCIL